MCVWADCGCVGKPIMFTTAWNTRFSDKQKNRKERITFDGVAANVSGPNEPRTKRKCLRREEWRVCEVQRCVCFHKTFVLAFICTPKTILTLFSLSLARQCRRTSTIKGANDTNKRDVFVHQEAVCVGLYIKTRMWWTKTNVGVTANDWTWQDVITLLRSITVAVRATTAVGEWAL